MHNFLLAPRSPCLPMDTEYGPEKPHFTKKVPSLLPEGNIEQHTSFILHHQHTLSRMYAVLIRLVRNKFTPCTQSELIRSQTHNLILYAMISLIYFISTSKYSLQVAFPNSRSHLEQNYSYWLCSKKNCICVQTALAAIPRQIKKHFIMQEEP